MTGLLLVGAAFFVVIVSPLTLMVWAFSHRVGRLGFFASLALTLIALVTPFVPFAALALADALSGPRTCDPNNECYPYIYLWWIAFPIGCAWAVLVLVLGILWGRSRAPDVASRSP